MTSNNINVCVKVRPLIERELNENLPAVWSLVDENTIKSSNKEYKLSFDHIFDETRTTEELFNSVAKPIVSKVVSGINGTIFAYGQTSSGKTYCMMGTEKEPGIVPLCVNEIFKQIEQIKDREFLIRTGYIEIYNERIFDLLLENKPEINKIHETSSGDIVINQAEIVASSVQGILLNYDRGNKERRVGETHMNERSSRSHTIFRIVIESHENSNDGVFHVSTLNLVDLAGSERQDQTKATGERLREGGHINKSLLSLSKVIRELSDMNDEKQKNVDAAKYINYRDSKLTRILSASLGGNAMTAIICTITPVALEESYSTLIFASNAKKIKNQPKVNETVSDKVIMNRLQKEIAALKDELREEKSRNSEVSKIEKLIKQIFDRESQIIHFHSDPLSKMLNMNRRRTWMCPISRLEKIVEENQSVKKHNLAVPPPFISKRDSPNSEIGFSPTDDFLSNEVFHSPNKIEFGNTNDTDMTDTFKLNINSQLPSQIRTPKSLKPTVEVESPSIVKPATIEEENKRLKLTIGFLENELEELRDFKVLEEHFSQQETREQLTQTEEKLEIFENEMADKMIEIENLKSMKTKFDAMEVEHKKAIKEREYANNLLESVKYEYEQAKNKFKNREEELIQCLTEARKESNETENVQKEKIKNLEQILLKTEKDLYELESQKTSECIKVSEDLSKVTDLEKTIKDLQHKLQNVQVEKESVEKALQKKNTELETISDQILEYIQENDNLQAEIMKNNETIQLKDNKIADLMMKLAELEDISNRYQKIQQIVTVDETTTEVFMDESDEIYKFIVELRHTATRTEVENKQLMNQIAENNRINEEVEVLLNRIKDLESQLQCNPAEKEEIQLTEGECQTEPITRELSEGECQTEQSLVGQIENECQTVLSTLKLSENESQTDHNIPSLIEGECQTDTNLVHKNESECQTEPASLAENDCQTESLPDEVNKNESHTVQNMKTPLTEAECQTDAPLIAENDSQTDTTQLTHNNCQTEPELLENIEQDSKSVDTNENECQTEANSVQFTECESQTDITEEFYQKLNDLNELVKLLETEKEEMTGKIIVLEKTVDQFRMIQEILTNEEADTQYDESSDIIKTICKLQKNAKMAESYETEKIQIAEVNDILKQKIIELENNIINLKENIQLKDSEYRIISVKLEEQLQNLEEYKRIQKMLSTNETISEDSFNDSFGKMIYKLHQSASRSESLENEKTQLLNEIAEIRTAAEILSEKLLANQTLTETEFQLREKIDALETELKEKKDQLDDEIAKNNDYEINQLDYQIQIDELTKDKESTLSVVNELKTNIESKTVEIDKLQQMLEESRNKTSLYESEISELTSKLEHAKEQNVKLIDSNSDCAKEISKLDAELTNCRSQLMISNEENKALKKECTSIREQFSAKVKECEELKTRYRRRSEDNERKVQELEILNSKLLQDVGAAEALRISTEQNLEKITSEYSIILAENKTLKARSDDNDMKIAILDEKYSQVCDLNNDLNVKLKAITFEEERKDAVVKKLEREISELNEKISLHTTENETKNQMVKDLRDKCEKLIEEVKENRFNPKKSSSPVGRRSDEKELFTAQWRHNLEIEAAGTESRTMKSNIDRKTRRQSKYDEQRNLSSWELTQSESTQTDPIDQLCACIDLNNKIKQLQIDIRMKDSKIANIQRMANVNQYKYDLEDAKMECMKEKRENNELKETVKKIGSKLRHYQEKNKELELNQKCLNLCVRSIQTDNFNIISKDDYEKVMNEKNALENKLEEMKKQLSQLKVLMDKENQNSNTSNKIQNFSSSESGISEEINGRQDYEALKNEHYKLQKKYDTAKKLCNLRLDDITKLREDLQTVSYTAEIMSKKYEKAKNLCEMRMEKIRALRSQLGENEEITK